jgi:hypothetical protein
MSYGATFIQGLVAHQVSQQVVTVTRKATSFKMLHIASDWASSCELGSKASGFIKRRTTS